MKKYIIIFSFFLLLIIAGCGNENSNGEYIDIRERSSVLNEFEINDDNLPEGDIVKNETGATKGTPANIGDTVIFKAYLGEELGISVVNAKRGTSAYEIIKEKLTFIEEPPKDMEYILIEANFYSYDSKEEPYFITALDFELSTSDVKEKKYSPEHIFNDDDTKEYLKTGEKTKDGAIFLVPKETENLYAVYSSSPGDQIWFSLK